MLCEWNDENYPKMLQSSSHCQYKDPGAIVIRVSTKRVRERQGGAIRPKNSRLTLQPLMAAGTKLDSSDTI